jgi:hypothetical protein
MLVVNHQTLRSDPGILAPFQNWVLGHWGLSFFIGITTAIGGILLAVVVDLIRRRPLSWLLMATVSVLTLMWLAVTATLVL